MAEQAFDVFLCHNSEDKPAVIEVAQQLQQHGIRPWLDVWELQPGAIWQFALEHQIENIGAATVFVGQQGLGPWQNEEIYAFLQEFIRRKCPVIPVMLLDAPQQPRLPIFLRNRHWVDFRLQEPDPIVQLVWGITGERPATALNTAASISVVDTEDIQDTSTNSEIEALRQELELLRSQYGAELASPEKIQIPSDNSEIEEDLSSEKGVDYRRLRDLLKAGQWKEADQETADPMLEAITIENWLDATIDDLLNFPCADLKTINRLWVDCSDGRFGFSVQKEIYVQCGARLEDNSPGIQIWHRLCDRAGWRTSGSYIGYPEEVVFDTSAPQGHLPLYSLGFGWFGVWLCYLSSRTETCELQ